MDSVRPGVSGEWGPTVGLCLEVGDGLLSMSRCFSLARRDIDRLLLVLDGDLFPGERERFEEVSSSRFLRASLWASILSWVPLLPMVISVRGMTCELNNLE